MQITLFVRRSGGVNASCSKTVKSFRHPEIRLSDIVFIDKFSDIDYGMIKSDWWIVIYDNEFIQDRLLEAIVVAGESREYDAFVFHKIISTFDAASGMIKYSFSVCPRMFRKYVRIESKRLYPSSPVRMEALLNGWVMEHNDSSTDKSESVKDVVLLDGPA